MPDNDPNEFTEREKFIVSYFRSELSTSLRTSYYDLVILVISIGCIAMFLAREEMGYAFAGYALLAGRVYYTMTEGGRWARDYRGVILKYDAKLKALAEREGKGE